MAGLSTRLNLWLQRYHSDLCLDEYGTCYLKVENTLDVLFSVAADKSTLSFYIPLLSLHPTQDHSLALEALTVNLYKDISIQGTLGYDKQMNKLVYCVVLCEKHYGHHFEQLTEEHFHSIVDDIISNGQTLHSHFNRPQKKNASHSSYTTRTNAFVAKTNKL